MLHLLVALCVAGVVFVWCDWLMSPPAPPRPRAEQIVCAVYVCFVAAFPLLFLAGCIRALFF